MHHVYNGADLYVMASQMESFGLVYAEALSCGIPVIGTSVGGVPEVIDDGKSGILVSPDNHVELAKAMKRMLKTRPRMKKMGKQGRKHVREELELEKVSKALVGICESVIKSNKNKDTFKTKLKK
jgi:glycosyltransferase involved in cell wall biosynthesis